MSKLILSVALVLSVSSVARAETSKPYDMTVNGKVYSCVQVGKTLICSAK